MKPFPRNFFLLASAVAALAVGAVWLREKVSEPNFFPRLASPESAPSDATLKKILQKSEKNLTSNPRDLQALVDRGVAYFFLGPDHYADSLNALNTAWRRGAFDKRIFYYSGILYENLSLFEESEKQYERFLIHEPQDREIRLRAARLVFRMGKMDEAIAHYESFLKKKPKDATVLVNLALAYQKRHEEKKLAEKTRRKKSPADKSAAVSTSSAVATETDLQKAIAYLEQAQNINPELPEDINLVLAKLYLENQQWEKSVSAGESELKKNAAKPEALQLLTLSYDKLGLKEKALDAALRWQEQDPQSREAKQKVKILKSQIKPARPQK